MTVSVIIPTKLHPQYLNMAEESVSRQTVHANEIIISRGPDLWKKLNHAVACSRGDSFVILCEDDLLHPNFIEATLDCFDRNPAAGIAYTDIQHFGQDWSTGDAKAWVKEVIEADNVPFITSLCKKSVWLHLGGFDEKIGPYADWDFWLRAFYAGVHAVRVPYPLFQYRIHKNQVSHAIDAAAARKAVLAKHGLKDARAL